MRSRVGAHPSGFAQGRRDRHRVAPGERDRGEPTPARPPCTVGVPAEAPLGEIRVRRHGAPPTASTEPLLFMDPPSASTRTPSGEANPELLRRRGRGCGRTGSSRRESRASGEGRRTGGSPCCTTRMRTRGSFRGTRPRPRIPRAGPGCETALEGSRTGRKVQRVLPRARPRCRFPRLRGNTRLGRGPRTVPSACGRRPRRGWPEWVGRLSDRERQGSPGTVPMGSEFIVSTTIMSITIPMTKRNR